MQCFRSRSFGLGFRSAIEQTEKKMNESVGRSNLKLILESIVDFGPIENQISRVAEEERKFKIKG